MAGSKDMTRAPQGWLCTRLSAMMWLEFAVFGVWFATLGLVLATHGMAAIIGTAYLLSAVAAIVSPVLLGAVGDRYLEPRTVLALAQAIGGGIMLLLPHAVETGNAMLTLVLIFAYMLAFQPTLGLTNALALAALGDRQATFPYVRVFGTFGWVIAGLGIGAFGLSASTGVFYVNAAASALFAAYALTLPATANATANATGAEPFSWSDALGIKGLVLYREKSFAVLMACALMTSVSLGAYNAYISPYLAALGQKNVAGMMALGQISEVTFVVTIPFVLPRMGMKWALLTGMAAWGLRFAFFAAAASGQMEYAYMGVLLHGICNDYFIVVAAMYIARIAPPALATQAQGWLILMVSGFGQAIGSGVSGLIYGALVAPRAAMGPAAWIPLWSLPIALAVATTVVWVWLFRPLPERPLAPHSPLQTDLHHV